MSGVDLFGGLLAAWGQPAIPLTAPTRGAVIPQQREPLKLTRPGVTEVEVLRDDITGWVTSIILLTRIDDDDQDTFECLSRVKKEAGMTSAGGPHWHPECDAYDLVDFEGRLSAAGFTVAASSSKMRTGLVPSIVLSSPRAMSS